MDSEIDADRPLPAYYRRIKSGHASFALGAAMVAVGEIMEPSKTSVEIEQVAENPYDPDNFDLSFGGLPELN